MTCLSHLDLAILAGINTFCFMVFYVVGYMHGMKR